MLSIKQIQLVLAKHSLRPLKSLGQNFLIEKKPIELLLEAAKINKNNAVIEIGPGLGALTTPIAQQAKRVIAVEKDKGLTKTLDKILKQEKINNAQIINADILDDKGSPCQILARSDLAHYKVIANLPYNIATAVVMKFLESKHQPEIIAVMLQKEVAHRMLVKPPHMNKLAAFSQFYAQLKLISYISKNNFFPKPKVDSAILQIIPNQQQPDKTFTSIVNAGFCHPRKQLINNLSKELNLTRAKTEQWLQKNKIQPKQRAETLTVDNWIALAKTF